MAASRSWHSPTRHRRRLLKVGEHFRVFENVLAVKAVRQLRQLVESRLPLRFQNAGEVAPGVARVGPGKCIQRGRNHQFKIPLRQHLVGIFEVEHFALFGNAQLAVERVHRLRKNGSMRRSSAASHRAAASVEQPQLHPASRATVCRSRCARKISHVLVSMPPSLLESE